MKRRDMLSIIGVTAAWPLAARSQTPPRVRRLGVLLSGEEGGAWQTRLVTFQQALAQIGWVEGRSIDVAVKWGGHEPHTAQARARELIALEPDVILVGPTNVFKVVQAQTRSIPLVFVLVSDPLGQGLVDSLARPSGNATGFTNLEFSMLGKWLDILKEIAPGLSRVGLMIHVSNGSSNGWYRTFDTMAQKTGIVPVPSPVRALEDVDRAVEELASQPGAGLIVPGDSFMSTPHTLKHVIDLAARLRVPTISSSSATNEFVANGGLVSYGIDGTAPFRLAAGYVDRILKGEKPSDLPVQQPTRFRFAINLTTAKALGLSVPLSLQVAADEVIE